MATPFVIYTPGLVPDARNTKYVLTEYHPRNRDQKEGTMNRVLRFINETLRMSTRMRLIMLLMITPVSKLYLFLEVSSNLLLVKNLNSDPSFDLVKFFKVVQLNDYNDDVVDLSHFAITYLWSNYFLDTKRDFKNGEYSLREVLSSQELFKENCDCAVDYLLNNLPFLLKWKARLQSEKVRMSIRKEAISQLKRRYVS